MRIAYVIYNERPASGLIRTQVVSLLKEIKRQAPSADVTLIAFWQPWLALRHRNERLRMNAELEDAGIRVKDYPWALIPSRHFLYEVSLFPILYWWAYLIFLLALRERFDVVHSRAYFPSLLAARLQRRYGHRCVFDMRSLWPKEHVTTGAWSEEDAIYRMWQRLEVDTIEQSEASVGVSEAMVMEMHRMVPSARTVLIPICVDTGALRFDEAARTEIRQRMGWQSRWVVAYQGSLGLLNRNFANVAEHMAAIRAVHPTAFFVVLTPRDVHPIAAEYLSASGVEAIHYHIEEPDPADLHKWLSAADAGIHAMAHGPDSASRLGVKVVEYLSCGLPILVNRHVGAAADLVDHFGVGAVLALDRRGEIELTVRDLASRSASLRSQCRRVAEDRFSVESCAAKYLDLYRDVLAEARHRPGAREASE